MATHADQLDRDDWAQAMAHAAGLDAGTTTAEPTAPLDRSRVAWQTLHIARGSVDVQIVESGRLGRKLLVVEYDAGDQETERRIMAAIG